MLTGSALTQPMSVAPPDVLPRCPASVPTPRGRGVSWAESTVVVSMGWWLAWLCPLAWVAGTAVQLGQRTVSSLALHALALAVAAGLLVFAVWTMRRAPYWLGRGAACVAAALLLGWGLTGMRASARLAEAVPSGWQGREVPLCVQIDGLPARTAWGVRVDAILLGAEGQGCQGARPAPNRPFHRLQLQVPEGLAMTALRSGEVWRLRAKVRAPDGLANPGGHDAELGPFARGVRAVASVRAKPEAPVRVAAAEGWSDGWVERARHAVREAIAQAVSNPASAGVLAGLAVGDQSAIERDDWAIFRQTGVAHVVAISGTHVVMCGWLVAWLVRRLWGRVPALALRWPAPEVARWVGVAGAAGYAVLAGWGLPAQRTVWMLLIVSLLRSGARRWPWPLVCLWAAAGVLAFEPWAWRQAGFWLSFVAVAVLMNDGSIRQPGRGPEPHQGGPLPNGPDTLPTRPSWRGRAQTLWAQGRELLRVQVLVTLSLAPVTLACFQQFSLIGLVANLVAIPVFTLLITPMALLGVVWSPIWGLAAHGVEVMRAVLGWLAEVPYATWSSPETPLWLTVGMVAAGMLCLRPWPWRLKLLLMPSLLPLAWLPPTWRVLPPPAHGFHVVAADVGQGSAVLVRTARHALLFDAGPAMGREHDAGERVVLPLLQALGVTQLDTLMLSHEDADHAGGARAVLRGVPVMALHHSLPAGHPLLAPSGEAPGPRPEAKPCEAGQAWTWDGVRFEVLHPFTRRADRSDGRRSDGNAHSCVLRVSVPARAGQDAASLLLTGDIGHAEERALVARHGADVLSSTVLVVPHHGSAGSSSEALLKAVQPRDAVVQVGRRNAYGHPSPVVMRRYSEHGIAVRGTPACGAWTWDSTAPRGSCWRDTTARYWFVRDGRD